MFDKEVSNMFDKLPRSFNKLFSFVTLQMWMWPNTWHRLRTPTVNVWYFHVGLALSMEWQEIHFQKSMKLGIWQYEVWRLWNLEEFVPLEEPLKTLLRLPWLCGSQTRTTVFEDRSFLHDRIWTLKFVPTLQCLSYECQIIFHDKPFQTHLFHLVTTLNQQWGLEN